MFTCESYIRRYLKRIHLLRKCYSPGIKEKPELSIFRETFFVIFCHRMLLWCCVTRCANGGEENEKRGKRKVDIF